MNQIKYKSTNDLQSIYDSIKEILTTFSQIRIWNNKELFVQIIYTLNELEMDITVKLDKSLSVVDIIYIGKKNKPEFDEISIIDGLQSFTEIFQENFNNLHDIKVYSVEMNNVLPIATKQVDSLKIDKLEDLEHKISEINFKMANEAGIAGFIFSLLLPLYKNFMIINLNTDIFSHVRPESEYFNFVAIIVVFAIIGLILSIKGCIKDSNKYQNSLADWGLIFNILNVIDLTIAIVYSI